MKKLLASLVVVFAICAAANATVVSYTVSFNDSFSGYTNFTEVLSVPQFDASLGTLLNVKLDYGVAANGTIGFENAVNGTAGTKRIRTFTYGIPTTDPDYSSTYGSVVLNFGANTLSTVTWDVANTYTFTVGTFDGTVDYAGTSGWSTVYLAKTASGSATYTTGLGSFIGTGNVNFDLIGDAFVTMSFPNGTAGTTTTGSGDVTITYEYIPEPATMSLLALGGLLLRRKK